MSNILFKTGKLQAREQDLITAGFAKHTQDSSAPAYEKARLNWLAYSSKQVLIGALTADELWDWIYIDEP